MRGKYEDEGQAERSPYVLIVTAFPHDPNCHLREEVRGDGGEGMKLRLRKGRRKGVALMFVFLFPTSGKYLF